MAVVVKNEIEYQHHFDPKTKRHKINGIQSVFHCHHYASLYTQLAIDAGEAALLQECARASFRTVLETYFGDHPCVDTIQARIEIACQCFALLGLGKMRVAFLGEQSGRVELPVSHVDDGWKKKWGEYDKPVNYITAGYIEALFEVVLDAPPNAFDVVECQSIVMGAACSSFKVSRR